MSYFYIFLDNCPHQHNSYHFWQLFLHMKMKKYSNLILVHIWSNISLIAVVNINQIWKSQSPCQLRLQPQIIVCFINTWMLIHVFALNCDRYWVFSLENWGTVSIFPTAPYLLQILLTKLASTNQCLLQWNKIY